MAARGAPSSPRAAPCYAARARRLPMRDALRASRSRSSGTAAPFETRAVTRDPRPEAHATAAPHTVRLQKLLADAGVASRRAAERLIAAGRVTVNGAIVRTPGSSADPG